MLWTGKHFLNIPTSRHPLSHMPSLLILPLFKHGFILPTEELTLTTAVWEFLPTLTFACSSISGLPHSTAFCWQPYRKAQNHCKAGKKERNQLGMKNICLSLLFLISSPWKVTPCRPGTINERRLQEGSPWGGLRPLLVAEQLPDPTSLCSLVLKDGPGLILEEPAGCADRRGAQSVHLSIHPSWNCTQQAAALASLRSRGDKGSSSSPVTEMKWLIIDCDSFQVLTRAVKLEALKHFALYSIWFVFFL